MIHRRAQGVFSWQQGQGVWSCHLWHHMDLVPSCISTVFCCCFFIAASISFIVMGWLMQLSDVDRFCSCDSCFLTWQILSLGSLTLLSSWYSFARQLAASFWTISFPSDCRTVCAFSGLSPISSLVSFHNLSVSFSMLREDVFSCQAACVCWSFCLVNSALALL